MALGFLGSLPHLDLDGDAEEGGEHPGWAESSNESPTCVFPLEPDWLQKGL